MNLPQQPRPPFPGMSGPVARAGPASLAAPTAETGGLTWSGALLLLVTLALPLSAWTRFRVEVGALQAHPYLLALLPLFVFCLFFRVQRFPALALAALTTFAGVFAFSAIGSGGGVGETVKLGASLVTLFTAALAIRSDADFRWVTLSLLGGVAWLTILGLIRREGSFVGVDPLESANENAFSLYTLPPLLLAGFLVLDERAPKWMRVAATVGALIVVVGTFSSANRSGWAGALAVPVLLLFLGRWFRTGVAVAGLAVLAYYLFHAFGDTEVFRFRWGAMAQGATHDDLRIQLFFAALKVGMDNPLLGVGPQNLPLAIGKELQTGGFYDPHNLIGYLVGGTGFISTTCLLLAAWLLFRKPAAVPARVSSLDGRLPPNLAHRLLRMMFVLFMLRGMFTGAVLVTPGFAFGIGATIGLCIAHGVWSAQPRRAAWSPLANQRLRPA